MALMMGVDMVLKSNKTKARKNMIAKGVAGRSIVGGRDQTSVVWPKTHAAVGR
jgi:hypothetical protein